MSQIRPVIEGRGRPCTRPLINPFIVPTPDPLDEHLPLIRANIRPLNPPTSLELAYAMHRHRILNPNFCDGLGFRIFMRVAIEEWVKTKLDEDLDSLVEKRHHLI